MFGHVYSITWDSLVCLFCFFKAEDGIRDLVRSRGLGDVYKRQGKVGAAADKSRLGHPGHAARHVRIPPRNPRRRNRSGCRAAVLGADAGPRCGASSPQSPHRAAPVSYTHLTLPTSDLV